MRNSFKYRILSLAYFFVLFFAQQVYAQDNNKAFAAADSSKFSPNKNGGWQLYNSFINNTSKDSVQLELIMQYDGVLDWKTEQFLGRIKETSFKPIKEQELPFKLLNETYV